MAPEVIKQAGYGRQADIWSLGCTVLEMATGKPPWSTEYKDQVSALYNIAISNSTPPIPDFLSEQCKDFLMQCFRRNARERPNAKRLLRHLWLSGSPLSSPQGVPTSPFTPPPPDPSRHNINITPLPVTLSAPAPAASGPPGTPDSNEHNGTSDNAFPFYVPKTEIQLKLPNDKFKKLNPVTPQSFVSMNLTTPTTSPQKMRRPGETQPFYDDIFLIETSREGSYETENPQDRYDMELSPDVPGLVTPQQEFYTI